MSEVSESLARAVAERYRFVRPLGAGGMAEVHLARDLRHDRDVAIKVMRPELAAHLGAERFLREIRLIARLQHPHILGLADSGEADGALWYVMPYLPGGSLRARLDREHELPLAEALRVLREIAGALEYAHAEGVVHRDIKPENVLFSAGHAQVADFGIARIVDGADSGTVLTTAGVAVGTPQYMAPEQAAGDTRIDHRADLYSFGVLAYEILAGAPPFTARSAAQLAAMHLSEPPAPLARKRPSVSDRLAELVMRCLAKRPADRWQSASELIAELDRVSTTDGSTPREAQGARTTTELMTITETMARRIDRERFDPRMIGDSLEYLDNHARSDVLVLLLNAVWLDGSDCEPHLRTLPYRCVAPTLYGFGARPAHRFPLSLRDHTLLLAELVQRTVDECRPAIFIAAGFSASADLVMRLPSVLPEGMRTPDGIFAIGPNQSMETCFTSRVMARLEGNDSAGLLAALTSITSSAPSLEDWMLLNGYLGRIIGRFRSDIAPLRALGRDIVEPFEKDDSGGFATMYREATARARVVRCVFEDSEICNRLLRAALVDHMDRRSLGERHRDGSLQIESTPSHFELMQLDRVSRHLAAMVEELRGAGV